MLASIVSLIESHLGAAARAVLPAVIHEVSALVGKAEKGEALEFGRLAEALEREAGQVGRSLLERIIARATHGVGPVNGRSSPPAPWMPGPRVGAGLDLGAAPFDPFKHVDPGKIAREIERKVEATATQAVKGAEQAATSAVHEAQTAATQAVRAAGSVAEQGVEAAGAAALREVKGVWHDVESGLFGTLAKAGLAAAIKVAEASAPSSLQVTLGPVQMSLADDAAEGSWASRGILSILKGAERHPPHDRATLRSFIEDLQRAHVLTGVALQGDVALAALVVESDALSVGFTAQWDAPTFLERFDALMDAVGLH
ncbi:MAG: hypothetical protein OXN91_00460 [Chloroflexota bacterium]|nr:hypothetical protein [Chloroflexota bacterium]